MGSPTDLRNMAKRSLVAEVASTFGQVHLRVSGTSMVPSLWSGDVLTICPVKLTDVVAGDVVVFSRDSFLITHRVIRTCASALITRGDSLPFPDSSVSEDELLGRVVSILRNGRRIDPSPAWWQRAGGWILRRSQLSTRVLLGLRTRLGAKTT
jgi:signal peptidase I